MNRESSADVTANPLGQPRQFTGPPTTTTTTTTPAVAAAAAAAGRLEILSNTSTDSDAELLESDEDKLTVTGVAATINATFCDYLTTTTICHTCLYSYIILPTAIPVFTHRTNLLIQMYSNKFSVCLDIHTLILTHF